MRKRQLISIVSVAVLAAHVGAGCCAHHQHGHASNAGALVSAEHGHEHSHAAHTGECNHSASGHEQEPGDQHCGEGHCTYLAGSKVVMPDLSASAALVTLDAATLLAQVAGPSAAQAAPDLISAAPPVRPHLLNQVLLI